MTIEEYESWKKGEYVTKFSGVIKFWETNPTNEQAKLCSYLSKICLGIGFIFGIVFGVVVGMCISFLYTVI
jgi:hypothetical protein